MKIRDRVDAQASGIGLVVKAVISTRQHGSRPRHSGHKEEISYDVAAQLRLENII